MINITSFSNPYVHLTWVSAGDLNRRRKRKWIIPWQHHGTWNKLRQKYTRLSFPVTKDKERVVTEQGSAWPCFSLAGYRICKKWRRDSCVRPARWPDSQKTNGSFSPTQNLVVPYTCTIEFCHETIRKTSTPTITLAFFGDSVLLKNPSNFDELPVAIFLYKIDTEFILKMIQLSLLTLPICGTKPYLI